mmetsp:Transcript_7880/g.20602  ORF Transcript_7880/g.20602 Transcript_7880/m.20602 type:complete len:217 (+) Transcript_7880:1223-1873(+)
MHDAEHPEVECDWNSYEAAGAYNGEEIFERVAIPWLQHAIDGDAFGIDADNEDRIRRYPQCASPALPVIVVEAQCMLQTHTPALALHRECGRVVDDVEVEELDRVCHRAREYHERQPHVDEIERLERIGEPRDHCERDHEQPVPPPLCIANVDRDGLEMCGQVSPPLEHAVERMGGLEDDASNLEDGGDAEHGKGVVHGCRHQGGDPKRQHAGKLD